MRIAQLQLVLIEDIRHDLLVTRRKMHLASRKLAYLQISLRAVSASETRDD